MRICLSETILSFVAKSPAAHATDTAASRLIVQPYDEDEQFFTKFYK